MVVQNNWSATSIYSIVATPFKYIAQVEISLFSALYPYRTVTICPVRIFLIARWSTSPIFFLDESIMKVNFDPLLISLDV